MTAAPPQPQARWTTRLLIAGTLAGFAGLPILGTRWAPWLIILAVTSLALLLYGWWFGARGPGAVMRGLLARWLELSGARRGPGGYEVRVFDGLQPLRITLSRNGRDLCAQVTTRLSDTTLAFRLWPDGQEPPSFTGSMSRELCDDLRRAPAVEARLANLYRADANQPRALDRAITRDLMAPLLAVRKAATPGYRGVTFDGASLSVHWRGPATADPERVMQLSRPIWAAMVVEDAAPQSGGLLAR
ncbi:MAG: hypothetical protein CSA24_01470 [Deltaproteobacteria bacterium]|nr:MAG: hypothetical protein CSA24_01470 [Deltaproteobacteria bacterium]